MKIENPVSNVEICAKNGLCLTRGKNICLAGILSEKSVKNCHVKNIWQKFYEKSGFVPPNPYIPYSIYARPSRLYYIKWGLYTTYLCP